MDRQDLEDLFAPAGRLDVRRMFGGFGVFDEGLMIAIATGGVVYLKVDGESEAAFLAEGLEPFSYVAKGRPRALRFRRLPEAAFEDPDDLLRWTALARAAARREAERKAAQTKRPRKGPDPE